jgi:hypothetical protein
MVAEVTSHLPELDAAAAERFAHLTRYMLMPLSTYVLEPVWNDMLTTIRSAVARARVELRDRSDKIYAPGKTG